MDLFRRISESRLTVEARFVAVGLTLLMGRRTEIEASSEAFRSALFPGENVEISTFKKWLAECCKAGIFDTVSVNGQWWLRKGGETIGKKRTAKRPASPVVMTFPVQGSDQEWELTQADVDRWVELYPALDVMQALRGALAHVETSTAKRRTSRGMRTFLVGWLNREVKWQRPGVRTFESREGRVRGDLTGAFLSLEEG